MSKGYVAPAPMGMAVCAAAKVHAGYTVVRLPAAAKPPDTNFAPKSRANSVFGLYFGNNLLKLPLKAKTKACMGRYRMQFAKLPFQKRFMPCSL